MTLCYFYDKMKKYLYRKVEWDDLKSARIEFNWDGDQINFIVRIFADPN